MGLKDIGESLPPGFKFFPSDEELVCHYLCKKISNEEVSKGTLVEIDLHTCEPWQLPEVAKLNATEWYFFSFKDRKYATGYRANRATTCGYWKATGKDRVILDPITRQVVGMRKTLVFYRNRAPNGIKTAWIMHEFRMEAPHTPPKEDWVLCRVFSKTKGENDDNNNNNNYHQEYLNILNTNITPINPMAERAISMPTSCGYQRSDSFTLNPSSQIKNDSNALDSTMMLNPESNLLQLLKEGSPSNLSSINEMLMEDEYGFMKDMDLDLEDGLDYGHHHHHLSVFGDMGNLLEDGNGIALF